MFCTKCGNQVLSSDRFCSKCGAEIRQENSTIRHSFDDDVFNPPFKREAEKRTEEIITGFAPERTAYKDRTRNNAHIDLNWNNSDYPTKDKDKNKTEAVSFDWSSVVDKKKSEVPTGESYGMKTDFEPIIPFQEVDIKKLFPERSTNSEDGATSFVDTMRQFSFANPDFSDSDLAKADSLNTEASDEGGNDFIFDQLEAMFNKSEDKEKTTATFEEVSPNESTETVVQPNAQSESQQNTLSWAQAETKGPEAGPTLSNEEFETALEGKSIDFSKTIAYTPVKSTPKVVKSEFELQPEELDGIEELDKVVVVDLEIPVEESGEPAKATDGEATHEPSGATYEPAESTREIADAAHETVETARETAESTRETAESTRETAEATRETVDAAHEPLEEAQDPKFNTFIEKQEAFKALLEKERQRIRDMEAEKPGVAAANDDNSGGFFGKTPAVSDVVDIEETMANNYGTIEEAKAENNQTEIFEECKTQASEVNEYITEKNDNGKSDVTAVKTAAEDFTGTQNEEREKGEESADNKAEIAQDGGLPSGEERTNLRYSDIFPGINKDDGGGYKPDRELQQQKAQSLAKLFDEDEEEKVNKHIITKVLLILLLVVVVGEGIILGTKLVNPESKISIWSDNVVTKIADLFMGEKSEKPADTDDNQGEDVSDTIYWEGIILEEASDLETIGEVGYLEELTYELISTPAFEEVASCGGFTDMTWYTDYENVDHTYAEAIVACLAKYYDSWLGANSDETLVGINRFDIGEVRSSDEGFYVLVKITFATADGSVKEVYETVNLLLVDQTAVVNEVREETV